MSLSNSFLSFINDSWGVLLLSLSLSLSPAASLYTEKLVVLTMPLTQSLYMSQYLLKVKDELEQRVYTTELLLSNTLLQNFTA